MNLVVPLRVEVFAGYGKVLVAMDLISGKRLYVALCGHSVKEALTWARWLVHEKRGVTVA